jgi:hypothetical protein
MIRIVRGERIRAMTALRPYGMHAFLLAYTVVILCVDGRFAGHGTQAVLGLLTFGVLAVCVTRLSRRQRLAALICVPVATLFEVFGSLIWGGYHYRFGNIPLYVPPGHALVYVFGITAAALPFVDRHPDVFRRGVLAIAAVWAVAGVTIFPLTGHRSDVVGLTLLPLLAVCILRSRRGTMFAAIFIAVATLEIAGTLAGDWAWEAHAPWSGMPSGNPPSVIAAGYAVIDGTVVLVAEAALFAALRLRRRTAPAPPATPAEPVVSLR